MLHWGTSSSLREMEPLSYRLVGLLSWGRSCGESGVTLQAHQQGTGAGGSQPLQGPTMRILIRISAEFPSESWLNPISMVIHDIKISNLGSSGFPGEVRVEGVMWQPSYAG